MQYLFATLETAPIGGAGFVRKRWMLLKNSLAESNRATADVYC